jgi:hypothetical protein
MFVYVGCARIITVVTTGVMVMTPSDDLTVFKSIAYQDECFDAMVCRLPPVPTESERLSFLKGWDACEMYLLKKYGKVLDDFNILEKLKDVAMGSDLKELLRVIETINEKVKK